MVDGTDTSTASTDPGTACTDTGNGITDTGTATSTASTDTGIEGTETCKVPSSTAGPNMKKKIIAGVALMLVVVALSALAVVLASGEKKVTIDASEQNNTKSGIQDEKTPPESEAAPESEGACFCPSASGRSIRLRVSSVGRRRGGRAPRELAAVRTTAKREPFQVERGGRGDDEAA